jgi:hypothetical protein
VMRREMPPWMIDRTVGVQHFKNDISLTDEQIATIVSWVDGGLPAGDPKDMPAAVNWTQADEWHIGTPDLIVTSPKQKVPAQGPDWWGDLDVDPKLTEDRYIQAVETKPIGAGRRVVHHGGTYVVQPDGTREVLSEFAVGKYGDIYPEGAARLLKAGSKVNFNLHLHSVGEEIDAQVQVAYKLYPKGYVPKYKVVAINVGSIDGRAYREIDIPANSVTRHDAFFRLPKAARLVSFQPHMHIRGKAMTMEAVFPNGKTTTISAVDRFDFNWHVSYVYDDDYAPLLPAGTTLHTIGIHDNTASNRLNPDPNMWVGYGMRTFDEMMQCHVLLYYLDDGEYQQQLTEREAKRKARTDIQ